MRGNIRFKHYSIRTEQTYLDWIKRFILHFDKVHPKNLGAKEVEQFLTYLAVEGKVELLHRTKPKVLCCFSTASYWRLESKDDSLIYRKPRIPLRCIRATRLIVSNRSPDAVKRNPGIFPETQCDVKRELT